MVNEFWTTEEDLTDAEQKRIDGKQFEGSQPDGAAKSIESAAQIDFGPQLEQVIEERAEAIQTIDNDPDIPDRFEDDVYQSQERAEDALSAVALRGMGAAQGQRGVDSPVQWGIARVDDFAGIVKTGDPDDSEYNTDDDLLPGGHPDASRNGDTPFVEGMPDDETQGMLDDEFL